MKRSKYPRFPGQHFHVSSWPWHSACSQWVPLFTWHCAHGWKTKLPLHAQLGKETMETSWLTVATPVIECCLLLCRMIWYVFGKHCFRKRKMDCVCSRIHNILHPESTHKTRDFSARRRSLCQNPFQLWISTMIPITSHMNFLPLVHWTRWHTAYNSKNIKSMNILCKMPPPVSVENSHQNVQLIFTLTGWNYMGTKTWQKDPPTYPITVKTKSIWSANGNRDYREFFSKLVFAGTIPLLYHHACSLNVNKNDKYKTQRKNKAQCKIQTGLFSRLSAWHPHFGHGMIVQVARESTNENGLQMRPWKEHKTRCKTQSKQLNTKSVRPLFCCVLILRNLNLYPFFDRKTKINNNHTDSTWKINNTWLITHQASKGGEYNPKEHVLIKSFVTILIDWTFFLLTRTKLVFIGCVAARNCVPQQVLDDAKSLHNCGRSHSATTCDSSHARKSAKYYSSATN